MSNILISVICLWGLTLGGIVWHVIQDTRIQDIEAMLEEMEGRDEQWTQEEIDEGRRRAEKTIEKLNWK